MRTGNVGKVSNDFDWIFLGPNASATRDDALRWLAARVDASSVDEARRMLHGAGFSDPRRLHRYDSLPPDLRKEALEHQTKVEQEQTLARLIAKAKETPDNPGYYTKLRDELGIAPARWEPLSAERQAMLEKDIEKLEGQLAGLADAEKAAKIKEIGQKQGMLNASNPEAYATGGSGRLWVSERKGYEVPGFRPGENPLEMTAEMWWVGALDELPFLQDAVGSIRAATDAGNLGEAFRLLAKHGDRVSQIATRALKTESENWAQFELLGSQFTLVLERARSAGKGSLLADATADFAKVQGQAERMIMILENRTVDLLKEMKTQVKVSGTGYDALQGMVMMQLRQREMLQALEKRILQVASAVNAGRDARDWLKTPEPIKETATEAAVTP